MLLPLLPCIVSVIEIDEFSVGLVGFQDRAILLIGVRPNGGIRPAILVSEGSMK